MNGLRMLTFRFFLKDYIQKLDCLVLLQVQSTKTSLQELIYKLTYTI